MSTIKFCVKSIYDDDGYDDDDWSLCNCWWCSCWWWWWWLANKARVLFLCGIYLYSLFVRFSVVPAQDSWEAFKWIDLIYDNCEWLKLPSLFAAWLLWTFHTKSHNMKALVILIHSWSPFLLLTCLCGSLCSILEYFLENQLVPDYPCKSHDYDQQWADYVMAG